MSTKAPSAGGAGRQAGRRACTDAALFRVTSTLPARHAAAPPRAVEPGAAEKEANLAAADETGSSSCIGSCSGGGGPSGGEEDPVRAGQESAGPLGVQAWGHNEDYFKVRLYSGTLREWM